MLTKTTHIVQVL